MPHSSGGGSHGGGFHGGSHGGSSTRTSKSSFPGATRYIYYHNRMPVTVYANYDVTRSSAPALIAALVVLCVAVVIMMIAMIATSFHNPKKLNVDYDDEVYIADGAMIMSDEEEKALIDVMNGFLDKTGITPVIVTCHHEEWDDDYRELEDYAMQYYLDNYKDEKHWLLIYSEPADPNAYFNDWRWEGMQGDDTDPILTTKITDNFNKMLHKKLLDREKYTVAESFCETFEYMNKHVMDKYTQWGTIIAALVMGPVFMGLYTILIVIEIRKGKKMSTAFACNDEVVRQATCGYCGGVYIAGHHTACPYCQAQIPQEYAKEAT